MLRLYENEISGGCFDGCSSLKKVTFGKYANLSDNLLNLRSTAHTASDVVFYVYKGSLAYDYAMIYHAAYRLIE